MNRELEQIVAEVNKVVKGKDRVIRKALAAILAGGHVLLEDVPGTGKTKLAKTLAKSLHADFSRIQFTPDLLPADITGLNIFDRQSNAFVLRKGPVFTNILLADEINRATPRTQAGLLECMEERQVTVDGTTRRMGDVYTILATQNPVEQEGTYKLPEAQLDRFMMKVTMDYPTEEQEVEILERHSSNAAFVRLDDVSPVITLGELLQLRSMMDAVVVDRSLLQYIAGIVKQTRTSRAVFLGASPRAAVAMLQASKAYALLQGRDFVTPDDIKTVTPPILQHRLILTAEAEMEGYSALKVAQKLIDKVEVPK